MKSIHDMFVGQANDIIGSWVVVLRRENQNHDMWYPTPMLVTGIKLEGGDWPVQVWARTHPKNSSDSYRGHHVFRDESEAIAEMDKRNRQIRLRIQTDTRQYSNELLKQSADRRKAEAEKTK